MRSTHEQLNVLTYRTSVELYSHRYPRIPADGMDTNVSGDYWTRELVLNDDISIMVTTEDLFWKHSSVQSCGSKHIDGLGTRHVVFHSNIKTASSHLNALNARVKNICKFEIMCALMTVRIMICIFTLIDLPFLIGTNRDPSLLDVI